MSIFLENSVFVHKNLKNAHICSKSGILAKLSMLNPENASDLVSKRYNYAKSKMAAVFRYYFDPFFHVLFVIPINLVELGQILSTDVICICLSLHLTLIL